MSKYRNKITEVDGIKFHSKKEAKRWGELRMLVKAGEIRGLRRQVKFDLEVNGMKVCSYVADFLYKEVYPSESGSPCYSEDIIEDCKGFKTPEYNLKKKLMRAIHNIEIRET